MSTAPISAFFKKQPIVVNHKLKVKETKEELKEYTHKLEEALSKIKQ
jgi:hypothetical protein